MGYMLNIVYIITFCKSNVQYFDGNLLLIGVSYQSAISICNLYDGNKDM